MDAQTLNQRYPHMMPKEIVLWTAFLGVHQDDYDYYEYDVHIGEGATLPTDAPEMIRQISMGLTRKRIDVIGYNKAGIHIIEIKPDAGLNSIGQLMAYYYLYKIELQPSQPVKLNLITDIIDNDTRKVASAYGIKIYTVPVDWSNYLYNPATRKYIKKEQPNING